jgi:NADH-quinone oxidoreductase subunit N
MATRAADWLLLAPLLTASVWAIVVLLAEMFVVGRRYVTIGWLSVVGLGVTAYSATGLGAGTGVFGDAVALDGLTSYTTIAACTFAAVAVLMAMDYLDVAEIRGGEYYPLVLFAVVGIVVMAAATDLVVMFLGLETMSMAVYVLAGIRKREPRSNEAALKYFLLGAFASAFMLYGIALVYAAAGSTMLAQIQAAAVSVDASARSLLVVGAAMLLVGFGFKVAAVPFHLWTPDVYEGAPTSVTAFMATVVKIGAFAALIRTLTIALAPIAADLSLALWIGAAATMTVGNVVALRQTSIKRMLAYSSIAHSGYLLVGAAAATSGAASAMLFYLVAYGAMNLGAFGVVMTLARQGEGGDRIADLAGLGQSRPMLAVAMTLCMLSLTGIPPLGGFLGKLYLFTEALEAGQTTLVVVAVLNSVVSAFYYLGVVRVMYFENPRGGIEPLAPRPYLWAGTALAVAATVALGLVPGAVLGGAARALQAVLLGS